MPKLTYTGDEGLYYPTLSPPASSPVPGQSYDLDEDPGDGRWTQSSSKPTPAEEK